MAVRVSPVASARLDEIYRYTRDRWGPAQAERYLGGLFDAFAGLETGTTPSRPIPQELGVEGFCFRHARHVVYWRRLPDGGVGIVTVLHDRMHQGARLRADLGL